jgi:hypothetical protein
MIESNYFERSKKLEERKGRKAGEKETGKKEIEIHLAASSFSYCHQQ